MASSSPFFTAAAVLALATGISAHGKVTSPPVRVPGPVMVEACGQDAVDIVLKDDTVPLEKLANVPETCQVNLCRGALFEDNKDKVQTFVPGQVVSFVAEISIPHEGPAHVAIMDTATNKMIGDPLIEFDTYADEKLAELPSNNTNFEVPIPTTLAETQCTQSGECVLQWLWFGTNAKQTYENCVDFVMGLAEAPAAPPEEELATPGADEGVPAATPELPAGAIEEPSEKVGEKPEVPAGAIKEPTQDVDEKPKPVLAPEVPDSDDKLPVASPRPLPDLNLPEILEPAVPEPLTPQPVPGASGNELGVPVDSIGVPIRTPAGDVRIVPVPVSGIASPDADAVPISFASPEGSNSDSANKRVFLKTTSSHRKRVALFRA